MALWVCSACTAKYSVGAPRCPQCGSTDHTDDGRVSETPSVDEQLVDNQAADETAATTEPAPPPARAKRKSP